MKEEEIISQTESDLVDEICQKFERIGIDTSEWEYRFGDGHTAAEFIEAGIKWYLENKAEGSESYWKKQIEERDESYNKMQKSYEELYESCKELIRYKEIAREESKRYKGLCEQLQQEIVKLKSSIGEETNKEDAG